MLPRTPPNRARFSRVSASSRFIDLGTAWIASGTSALLVVPSIIVPEEANVLINPAHPDASGITARKVRKWTYDPRLAR